MFVSEMILNNYACTRNSVMEMIRGKICCGLLSGDVKKIGLVSELCFFHGTFERSDSHSCSKFRFEFHPEYPEYPDRFGRFLSVSSARL
jgi:hypothetical protein